MNTNISKKRLDTLLTDLGFAQSRERARAIILAGNVLVDERPVTKAGQMVAEKSKIFVKKKDHPYVSRGGVKLAAALQKFGIDPSDKIALDIGASTGGFTDCLLQLGARKVWAIDVGKNQLDYRLRTDPRVISMEGVNAREIDQALITDPIDIVVADVSFISLRLAVPPLLPALGKEARLILLAKPQFEAGRTKVGKGGIVKDAAIHKEVIDRLVSFFVKLGLDHHGVCESPIEGRKGNREYFIYFRSG
ncbi:RNA binding methyltransferase FtsJ like [hydrothermal vent metagenome]|uniref:RNA binding methyltransferase FtsJ like n=1 Tax=hydrothermal vent metagenome TaxID=652676 RepID=A0A3B1CIT5_9ZZZZ